MKDVILERILQKRDINHSGCCGEVRVDVTKPSGLGR